MRTGVTLLEVLVTLSVIAVLATITLPALHGVRRNTDDAKCRAVLHGVGQMYMEFINEHDGAYPSWDVFPPPTNEPIQEMKLITPSWEKEASGRGGFWVLPSDQVELWAWFMREYAADDEPITNPIRGAEMVTCPYVLRRERGEHPHLANATRMGGASYLASPALFTRIGPWMNVSDRPVVINAEYAPVQASSVMHPARKSVLVERQSFHDARRVSIAMGQAQQYNILAADGHVERLRADASAPGYPMKAVTAERSVGLPMSGWVSAVRLPFLTTTGGAAGRDW